MISSQAPVQELHVWTLLKTVTEQYWKISFPKPKILKKNEQVQMQCRETVHCDRD